MRTSTPILRLPALVSVAIADTANELSHAINSVCETYFPAAEQSSPLAADPFYHL